MIEGIFSSEIYQILEKSLDAGALQQKMISNNIANVNTPGYKSSEVVFMNKLQQALEKKGNMEMPLMVTHKNHIPLVPDIQISSIEPEIITRNETTLRTDGNNVDIDFEMSKMAENTAQYSTMAQLMSLKLGMLRTAITEGRR